MPAEPLTAREREEIRAGIERGDCDGGIAWRLGRNRCTVNREINRNGGRGSYCAVTAQGRADGQRLRPKTPKLAADPALAAYVTRRLEARDSPMTISIELARGLHGLRASISHEAIYLAVYAQGSRGLRAGVHDTLHLGRRRRKTRRRRPPGSHSLGFYCRIHDRPVAANERSQVGHLEGDQIVGRLNQSALLTVFDRASRHLWLGRPNRGKGAEATTAALTELLERIPAELRRTLTWDQGAELARHREIALTCGIDIYFADPKSPWQRPTNENGNALVRRYVGKSTDLSTFTDNQLRAIEHRINTIPRRSLNWATAHHTYTAAVAMTE